MMALTCRSLAPRGGSGTGHPNTPQPLSPGEVGTAQNVRGEQSSSPDNSAIGARKLKFISSAPDGRATTLKIRA